MQNFNSAPTLRQAFTDFLTVRTKLKPSTALDYRKRLKCLADWMDLPITEITKAMVMTRHRELSTAEGPRGTGLAQANSVMRVLRSILNFGVVFYDAEDGTPLIARNPVDILSATRGWNKNVRRQGIIVFELDRWLASVLNSRNETTRDYFLFLLLTGCRRSEGMGLLWENVDLVRGYAVIKDTKNGKDLNIAFSDVVWEMLRMRKERAVSEYVFNGARQSSPLSSLSKTCARLAERSGVRFSPHDLRRTFVTIADSLSFERTLIKRLVNHTENDITSDYIISVPDRLREPMQLVADAILDRAKMDKLTVLNRLRESAGKKLVAGSMNFGQMADAYLASMTVSEGSFYEYKKRVYLTSEWHELEMKQITTAMAKERYDFLCEHYSVKVADKALLLVHQVFLFALKNYVDRKITSPVVWAQIRTVNERQSVTV